MMLGHGASIARLSGLAFAAWVCWLSAPAAPGAEPAKPRVPTFAEDVAAILQNKCQGCHRRGQVGPFCLESYEQARKRASDIASVVEAGTMPPWKPAPGVGPKLQHDKSLTEAEAATLRAWAEAGAPSGDLKKMPAPPKLPEGWRLGPPDLVLEPAEDFAIPAAGKDIYRCFVIPTALPDDVFISAVEFRPTNPKVVHHLSTFIDPSRAARALDEADPGPGYTMFSGPGVPTRGEVGGWAAGNEPVHLPDGVGRKLPKGSDVILQVHYHPSGKPEVDRTRIGLYFAKKPVKQALYWNDASNSDFKLPAGKSDTEIRASWFVPVDVEAVAVAPHMHALGRDFRMSVTYPNGKTRDLLHIADWDPAWQSTYYFEKPITLPKGSTVKVVAVFDNSDHPRNPHSPPRTVKWGHGVNDEMLIGYVGVVKKGQDLTRGDKDDLFDIFVKQKMSQLRRMMAKRGR